MMLLHACAPGPHWLPAWLRWPGLALLVAGLGIAAWHARLFRRVGTNIHTFRAPQVLVTGGLFRHSRNPMYLGFVLALAGLALVLGAVTPALVAVAYAVVVDRWYIRFEEEAMARTFGEDYRRYRTRVRRWL